MTVASMYDDIINFMKEYFHAFSEYGQVAETQAVMDKYYTPDLVIDDNMMTSREQWYRACLSHPAIKDVLVNEHLFIDEKQKEVGALVTTQYINRSTREILVELKMNVVYYLKIDSNREIKISKFRVFVQSDVDKLTKMFQLFRKK
jgi:hypothetical protein